MEAVIKARNGSVLGKGSILKVYFFPGQRTLSDIQIHGAPHVYKLCRMLSVRVTYRIGGVADAMPIMCLRLQAGEVVSPSSLGEASYLGTSDEAALKQGEYRDILSLTRVLAHGPKSKVLVDDIIERCAGAGHVRNDIFNCIQELKKIREGDEEHKAS